MADDAAIPDPVSVDPADVAQLQARARQLYDADPEAPAVERDILASLFERPASAWCVSCLPLLRLVETMRARRLLAGRGRV